MRFLPTSKGRTIVREYVGKLRTTKYWRQNLPLPFLQGQHTATKPLVCVPPLSSLLSPLSIAKSPTHSLRHTSLTPFPSLSSHHQQEEMAPLPQRPESGMGALSQKGLGRLSGGGTAPRVCVTDRQADRQTAQQNQREEGGAFVFNPYMGSQWNCYDIGDFSDLSLISL